VLLDDEIHLSWREAALAKLCGDAVVLLVIVPRKTMLREGLREIMVSGTSGAGGVFSPSRFSSSAYALGLILDRLVFLLEPFRPRGGIGRLLDRLLARGLRDRVSTPRRPGAFSGGAAVAAAAGAAVVAAGVAVVAGAAVVVVSVVII